MRFIQIGLWATSLTIFGCTGDAAQSSEPTPADIKAMCGDLICDDGFENPSSCPSDCMAVCGDDACTHQESAWDCPADCQPTHVDVRFNYLLVGPVKSDGCQWDGLTCSAPQEKELVDALASLSRGAIATALSLYQSGVFNALNKPDPMGFIEYGVDYAEIPPSQDQFMAPFGAFAVFRTIPYNPSMFFNIQIQDEDLSNHDLIWTGNLRFQQFEQAFIAGNDFWIDLRTESQNQLVGINITVTPAQLTTEFP